MIDKTPTPGSWTDDIIEPYDERFDVSPALHDTPSQRQSTVLGVDGEPMWIDVPRRALGFDLRPKGERGQ